ncbi:MAG: hypothetical protein JWQ98_1048 [Chlorobi bacterium]|nr:hypothetical protein [Chlorobiota bacterium]
MPSKKAEPQPDTVQPEQGDSAEYLAFEEFARKVMAVPKSEIDAEERKEKRRKKEKQQRKVAQAKKK